MKQCMGVCLKQRKHISLSQNLGKIVKKTNYDNYTIGMYAHISTLSYNSMPS